MGKKTKNKTAMGAERELLDFSGDLWSYKGEVPDYPVQLDGYTHDIENSDGNDRNAISLGIMGMIIIVLNAKSPKIRQEDLLNPFNQVIGVRGWNILPEKEANKYAEIAIKKLTNAATSGDVFDLASYAPLEIKRPLLKKLFTISRFRMDPKFKGEAERRIVEDIVPNIFENPDYELAQLTGMIIQPEKTKAEATQSAPVFTPPVPIREEQPTVIPSYAVPPVNTETLPPFPPVSPMEPVQETPQVQVPQPQAPVAMSAFEELQMLYSRPNHYSDKEETPVQPAAVDTFAQVSQPVTVPEIPAVPAEPENKPAPSPVEVSEPVIPQPAIPVFSQQPASYDIPTPPVPSISMEPVDSKPEPVSAEVPQSVVPPFIPQPPMPNIPAQPAAPISFEVPQPPAPDLNVPQPAEPAAAPAQPQAPQSYPQQTQYGQMPQGYPQQNPYSQMVPQGQYGQMAPQGYPQQGQYGQMPQGYPQQNPYSRMAPQGQYPQMPPQGYPQQGQYGQMPQGYPQQTYPANMPNPNNGK